MLADRMAGGTAPLSERCKEIILGSLLGDGSLRIHEPYRNARFAFRHSAIQKEYFSWKARELAEIAGDQSVWQQGSKKKPDGWGETKLRFQSRALPALTEIFRLVHKHGKPRIRRKWLNVLTPLSLAVWWMDDGSLVADSRQGVFCTDGFSLEEVRILDRYMKKVRGIRTTIGQVGKTNRYRLWIRSTGALQKFLRLILPHISVASMLPKVLLLYRDPRLQQRWISEVVQRSHFHRAVVEKHLRDKKKRWKHFRE